jgi:hypothetical protein
MGLFRVQCPGRPCSGAGWLRMIMNLGSLLSRFGAGRAGPLHWRGPLDSFRFLHYAGMYRVDWMFLVSSTCFG